MLSSQEVKEHDRLLAERRARDLADAHAQIAKFDVAQVEQCGSIDRYFPFFDHGIEPCGGHILIQGKKVPSTSKAGIILATEFREAESYDIQIGKVVAMGPLAYKNKSTVEEWKEGKWVNVGDYVHIPRSGAKLSKVFNGERYWFALITDVEVIAKLNNLDEFTQFSY